MTIIYGGFALDTNANLSAIQELHYRIRSAREKWVADGCPKSGDLA